AGPIGVGPSLHSLHRRTLDGESGKPGAGRSGPAIANDYQFGAAACGTNRARANNDGPPDSPEYRRDILARRRSVARQPFESAAIGNDLVQLAQGCFVERGD